MMHILLHVLEEVVLVLNGEVGLYGAHVEANASDQDQENVMDLDVKDFPNSVIHVQEEVVLLVVFGEDGHHGANVEVIA